MAKTRAPRAAKARARAWPMPPAEQPVIKIVGGGSAFWGGIGGRGEGGGREQGACSGRAEVGAGGVEGARVEPGA